MTAFFDIDDTIYDRSEPFTAACREFFAETVDDPYSAYLCCNERGNEVFEASQRGDISMDEMYIWRYCKGFEDAGINITDVQALAFEEIYRRRQGMIRMSETMRSVLEASKTVFDTIGLITNGTTKKQTKKIETLGLKEYFPEELTVISGTVGIDKPDERIFALAESLAGKKPEELLYIGDSFHHDIVPACMRSWHTIWFNRRREEKPGEDITPDYTVYSEEELLALIKTFCV